MVALKGWDGPKGEIGVQRPTGLQGLKGNQGEQGLRGFTGFSRVYRSSRISRYQGIMGGIEMDISLNSGEYVWNGNSNNSYPDIEL